MLAVKEKFRTVMAYNCKFGEGPYIIQFHHNNCWIDWLEVKKPSADQYNFGLFVMQDIEPNKIIMLYLGEQYNSVEEKDRSNVGDTYTLLSHVMYN